MAHERSSEKERQQRLEQERREREQRERQKQENHRRWSEERQKTAAADANFTDKVGRPIALQNWESEEHLMTRTYDTSRSKVPEQIDRGQAGRAQATVERSPDGHSKRVRLNDIEVEPEYRKAGIAGKMLGQIEGFARKHSAIEVYGGIDSAEARDFWSSQAGRGWVIEPGGYYGTVRKKLSL